MGYKVDLLNIVAGKYGYVAVSNYTGPDGEHRVVVQQFDDYSVIDVELCLHISIAEKVLDERIVSRLKDEFTADA